MRFNIIKNSVLLSYLFVFISCQHSEESLATNAAGLFDTDSLLHLTLQFNVNEVLTDIKKDRIYHDAILFCEQHKLPVKIRTRGNFRRDPDICNFPPLTIQFDSLSTPQTLFANQQRLALVTHCQQENPLYEQFVLEEYGIYKTYNLLTDKSIRVRLAQINYQDTQNPTHQDTKLGFFIENTQTLAARLGGTIAANEDTISALQCNSFLMLQCAVFQFMIGNTDWSVRNKHNLVVLKMPEKMNIPIPYDFDCAGLIDAPYASPTPELGIERVTERLYRGYCQSEAELNWVLDVFKTKQQAIDSLWATLPYHDTNRKQQIQQYISNFYQIIQNQDSIQLYFIKNCR